VFIFRRNIGLIQSLCVPQKKHGDNRYGKIVLNSNPKHTARQKKSTWQLFHTLLASAQTTGLPQLWDGIAASDFKAKSALWFSRGRRSQQARRSCSWKQERSGFFILRYDL